MWICFLGFGPCSLFQSFADFIVAATVVTVLPFLGKAAFLPLPLKSVMENKANARAAFTSHRQIYEGAAGGSAVISAATALLGLPQQEGKKT